MLRCPKCGADEDTKDCHFSIDASMSVTASVTPDESMDCFAEGDVEWDSDSPTTCDQCLFIGQLKQFYVEEDL